MQETETTAAARKAAKARLMRADRIPRRSRMVAMTLRSRSPLAIALVLLLAACGGSGQPPVSAGAGAPAAAAADGSARLAPDFELKDIHGNTVHLSDSKGTVRLVDFWTTWCAPCREEIPMFKELHAGYAAKGFTLVGIAMDDEGLSKVKPFADENAIPYLTLIGSEPVAASFGSVVGYPTKFLVDRDGKIVETWVGPVPRSVLEKKIQALL
jgi:peroxiredoxin